MHMMIVISLSFFFFFILPRGMWDLIPPPGVEPVPPALGVWSLNHWSARKVPTVIFKDLNSDICTSLSINGSRST